MVAPPMDTAKYRLLAMLLKGIKINEGNYAVRNETVMCAIAEALRLGLAAGFRIDPTEPEWPVAYIELPFGGQVSWHLPQYPHSWDGHTTEEKYRRVGRFCQIVDAALRR